MHSVDFKYPYLQTSSKLVLTFYSIYTSILNVIKNFSYIEIVVLNSILIVNLKELFYSKFKFLLKCTFNPGKFSKKLNLQLQKDVLCVSQP